MKLKHVRKKIVLFSGIRRDIHGDSCFGPGDSDGLDLEKGEAPIEDVGMGEIHHIEGVLGLTGRFGDP